MLMLLRHVQSQSISMKNGKWRNATYIGQELKSKVIGIVGCGMIGRLVAQKLSGFEIPLILGYDPYMTVDQLKAIGIEKKELPELLREADVVTLHLPLTDQTKDLISTKELEMMKPTSYLVNTARGGIINEGAIIKALKENTIKGAALDVFTNEPNINPEYFKLSNVILTPHIAWMTEEANLQMALIPIKKFLEVTK
jgi:D-3-phosphoglycerate dehydrogenase